MKITPITPKGRTKYGRYLSTENVTTSIVSISNAGNVSSDATPVDSGSNTRRGSSGSGTRRGTGFNLNLSQTSANFMTENLTTGTTVTTTVVGYSNRSKACTLVGNISQNTATTQIDLGITGIPQTGMVVTVDGNGTTAATINIAVSNTLSETSGTLLIPTNICLDTTLGILGADNSAWLSLSSDKLITEIKEWSWSVSSDATSPFLLDLSNQAATINCDKDGNILPGAVRPSSTARLWYGNTLASNVVYSITNYSLPTSGVSINSSTGLITFASGFNFTGGTNLSITIAASINGSQIATIVMTVGKLLAGQNGQNGQNGQDGVDGQDGDDATSYWLELSADAVKVSTSNVVTPSVITAVKHKQVGQQTPVIANECVVKYGHDTQSPSTAYPSSGVTVSSSWSYVSFAMYCGSTIVDGVETVPVLKDGPKGDKGDKGDTGSQGIQGRQGAAVRGPLEWGSNSTSRRFCNGTGPNDSDKLWIDVIRKDNTYYYCITSYNGSLQDTWANVSANWSAAGQTFEFIATKLLLAQNAAIDFLNGNEIYLHNTSGTITAGAAGGNGISFWAGSDVPSNAPFQVTYDGKIKATSGVFSGFVNCPYVNSTDSGVSTKSGTIRTLNSNYAYICLSDSSVETYYLPTPSAALNGFTYNLINLSHHQRAGSAGYTHAILTTAGGSRCFYKYTDFIPNSYDNAAATKLDCSAGFYQLVCTGVGNRTISYNWYLIQATGTAVPYNGSTKLASGYSVKSEDINLIDSDVAGQTTMYITH